MTRQNNVMFVTFYRSRVSMLHRDALRFEQFLNGMNGFRSMPAKNTC
nr:hypothetical protein [Lysobacter sp.]